MSQPLQQALQQALQQDSNRWPQNTGQTNWHPSGVASIRWLEEQGGIGSVMQITIPRESYLKDLIPEANINPRGEPPTNEESKIELTIGLLCEKPQKKCFTIRAKHTIASHYPNLCATSLNINLKLAMKLCSILDLNY